MLTIGITPMAFAERVVDFEKTVDVNIKSVEKYFKNFEKIQDVFPKSINSITQTENENIFKLNLEMNGVSLNPKVLYKNSDDTHLLKVLDGDLKGTTISTTLLETWGFDGTPNQGTVVNVKTKLNTSGFFSLVNFVPESSIIYTLDYSLSSIVSDVKGDSSNSSEKPVTKGYRSR